MITVRLACCKAVLAHETHGCVLPGSSQVATYLVNMTLDAMWSVRLKLNILLQG